MTLYNSYMYFSLSVELPIQQGMSGQHRAASDTTLPRRIAVGPMLAHFFVLAG